MTTAYVVHEDDGEVRVFPLDNLTAFDVPEDRVDEFIELAESGATVAHLTKNFGRPMEVDTLPPVNPAPNGHEFQVMCASCLNEPFDVEDPLGPCPELDEDGRHL